MAILAAISDDDRYEAVIETAARLAQATGQSLTVAHVISNASASGAERSFRDEIESFVEDIGVGTTVTLEHLDRSGLRSGTAVGKQLVDMSDDVAVEHIVIGHRSKGQLASLREGNTAFAVAEGVSVPVTIVPGATGE
ncbi:universal stress protein UspA [Halorubrum ezzemoulense DSM 17463]|uniref:Universal stress protein UspA n=1 Tax=Halorubrum ezzemoulense DSM 17463 TaxID=1121945 RepID=A0A1X4GPY3_HALEZ|nr:universal stress protein [Halorubrum ezzemoulense]OSP00121.1 universal stress protein UspA [Halorubrum ezzemoulense DSM 17463]